MFRSSLIAHRAGIALVRGVQRSKAATLPVRFLVPAALTERSTVRFLATAAPQTSTDASKSAMFCFQCEQTQDGKGCTTVGVCGKTPETAAMQDLLVHQLKGISYYAHKCRELGLPESDDVNVFTLRSLFSTLTNVNFDSERFVQYSSEAEGMMQRLRAKYEAEMKRQGKELSSGERNVWKMYSIGDKKTLEELENMGKSVGVLTRKEKEGENITALKELIVYGIKGMAAYAEHAEVLGKQDKDVFAFLHKTMAKITEPNLTADELVAAALSVGEMNLKVMGLLEAGSTERYGHPTPQRVRTTAVKGKCILVSGHDLRDVEEILKQTEGKGINVYTHGELLPAHGYPSLKKYPHLVGNFGGAWQLQKMDFAAFPGPIVMTTNCLIEPKKSYKDRIYTRSVVGWPGVKHISNYDFSEVISQAQSMPGFPRDEIARHVTTGFGRQTVLGIADKVLDAVKQQQVKHFFFIGGCDGSEGERNYFKELALATPKDSLILTAGCGKYRFNKFELGEVAGLPRLIDVGQCNDSYAAIQIAAGFAKALNTDVHHLPLSFAVSWFEQKAVAVLLTLLYLRIQNIRLGPHLPGFATPQLLSVLSEKFNLKPISTNIHEELRMMLQNK